MRITWPWRRTGARPVEARSQVGLGSVVSAAQLYGVTDRLDYSGVTVSEQGALNLSAVWRAVSLISQTIASMRTSVVSYADGVPSPQRSFLDDPAGADRETRFEFWEEVLIHLLLHGNAYLIIRRNGSGKIAALQPIHPFFVNVNEVYEAPGGKTFSIMLANGTTVELGIYDVVHITGLSSDGLVGYSPISIARNSLGTSIAGDRAAAKQFNSGGMFSMVATAEEDIDDEEVADVKRSITRVSGYDHAGEILLINRRLRLSPWTMSANDAQFLESRAFQIEEIARWFGVPPFALMQTDKQTSWGTGIESQQRGLAKTVLRPWTERISQRVNRLLPPGRFLEFDFAALERADPTAESQTLIAEVNAGLLTPNEARARRGLPPLDGGDEPRIPVAVSQPASALENEGGDNNANS